MVQHDDERIETLFRTERYNARALVNKGNCLVVKGELEKAKELYMEVVVLASRPPRRGL